MPFSKIAEQLSSQLAGVASQVMQAGSPLSENFEQQQQMFKTQLEAVLRKAGLVTQDEFEAQQAVLLKTREKLESLEKVVAKLEEQMNNN